MTNNLANGLVDECEQNGEDVGKSAFLETVNPYALMWDAVIVPRATNSSALFRPLVSVNKSQKIFFQNQKKRNYSSVCL